MGLLSQDNNLTPKVQEAKQLRSLILVEAVVQIVENLKTNDRLRATERGGISPKMLTTALAKGVIAGLEQLKPLKGCTKLS
jgi:hypothetical protein